MAVLELGQANRQARSGASGFRVELVHDWKLAASRWNGDGDASSARAEAAAPNIVARPVLTTSALASPVNITAPRNNAFEASPAANVVTMPGRFSTG